MADTSKVRRVKVFQEFRDGGDWLIDQNGTHVLVEHELWERVVKEISSPTTLETRKLLMEISGEDA